MNEICLVRYLYGESMNSLTKRAGSAGEENCQAIAIRLGWELSRLVIAILGGGNEALLGDGERLDRMGGLRGREETVDDVVHPDREGWMPVIDGFGAGCFREKAFSCCNLRISAWAVVKLAC
ncbi:hypothetical protein RO3G_14501 [Rhizopus delemar RA 99-880]|uniref:Uncharacterized protein n=1 Tax=Rhizopus delemar (strain RA 99-880 / ATCC MYA-4621 / FGSC 9543 / NRRL 43880) TaxID=246409 RepID=I1CMW0_RHIO9|nr:hypothetical protein RO3G_14501 [Rhizopus delemar RA 99-880]|eukprot:EIE89790.1 hypothetical protein RO3G_14501 [Rhizopus delemar RA 99-880]